LALLFSAFLVFLPAADASTIAPSAPIVQAFEEANRRYEQGKYEEAVAAYARLADEGVASAALHFNLGNAYFKSGQLGRAILSYRIAQQLDPRDPDIGANLRFVRSAVLGAAPPAPPLWQRAVSRLTLNEWAVIAAGALWLFAGLRALRQWVESPFLHRRLLHAATAVLLVLCLTGLGLAWHLSAQPRAVVVQSDAVLHHGPLDESPNLQTLQDGQELTVLDRKDDWLQVAGAARGTGWIRRGQVVLLP